MASPHDNAEQDQTPANWSQLLMWLIACVIAVGALSLFSIYAPHRLKLLGLFAIGHGAISGWVMAYFARMFGIRRSGMVAIAAFSLVVGAQVGMAMEAHRLRAQETRSQWSADPSSFQAAQLLNRAPPPDDPEALAQWQAMRDQVDESRRKRVEELERRTSFRAYLAHRVSALGDWPSPWPKLFWLAELIAGGIAAAAVAYASIRPSAAELATPSS